MLDGDPQSGRGTHVAGLIGAVANNRRAGAGVCWKTQLVSVRVLGALGGYVSDVIREMLYAHEPRLSAGQVASIIARNGDKLSGLSGKVAHARRLDLGKVLNAR